MLKLSRQTEEYTLFTVAASITDNVLILPLIRVRSSLFDTLFFQDQGRGRDFFVLCYLIYPNIVFSRSACRKYFFVYNNYLVHDISQFSKGINYPDLSNHFKVFISTFFIRDNGINLLSV